MKKMFLSGLMALLLLLAPVSALMDDAAAASGCSAYVSGVWVVNGYASGQVKVNCTTGGGWTTIRMSSSVGQNTSLGFSQSTYNSPVISLPDRAGMMNYCFSIQYPNTGTTIGLGCFYR